MKRLCTATLAAALLLGSFATTASANQITPSTTADDITDNGNCTLREAVQAANTDAAVDQCAAGSGTDVIQLGTGTYTLGATASKEDANQTGDLDVTAPLTIQGNGAGSTTIDAQAHDRVIDVLANAATTIQNLTLTNGAAPTSGPPLAGGAGESGGAVRAVSALTLTGVAITNSHAGDASTGVLAAQGAQGNAGGDGGGVWSDHAVMITGGRFASDQAGKGSGGTGGLNAASGSGNQGGPGGAGGRGGDGGAIAEANAQLTVTGTTFDTTLAGAGGNGGNGGKGDNNGAGIGHQGGGGGVGGRGGFGGAISTSGAATLTGITATTTSAGPGGVGGAGGQGGTGATQADHGDAGLSGNGGNGGDGGAVSGGAGTVGLSGATITGASAGTGGAGPQDVTTTPAGSPQAGVGGYGGGVAGNTVRVERSVISDAHAGTGGLSATEIPSQSASGGFGGSGGGIEGSTLTVTDTTVTGSTAGAGGEGASSQTATAGRGGGGGSGGGVLAFLGGTVTMTGSTLDHDSAGVGGNGGTTGNANSAASGGPGGNAGGLFTLGGTVTNTTFVSDAAAPGGAAGHGGSSGNGGDGGAILTGIAPTLALSHVTVTGSSFAPLSQMRGSAVFGAATVSDSVIAGNSSPQCSLTSNGSGNVSFPDTSCGGVNADPKLGPLADNGGPTKTLLLGSGSAALDISGSCSGSDQRGVPRPQGPACDSGAVEAANPSLSADGGDFGAVSQGGTTTKTVTVHATFDPLHPQVSLSSPDFSIVSDGCSGTALAPAATCAVQVKFTGGAALGPRSATLHVTHDAVGPPLDVPLSGTVIDATPPVLTGLTLTHQTFRAAKRKPPPKGTTIGFSLSEPSSVVFTVTQKLPGRRKGKRCVAPTKKLRHAKRCTRTVTLGSFTRGAGAGPSSVPFNGRVSGRKLGPGSYTLTLAPTDSAGNHGRSANISFKIVKK